MMLEKKSKLKQFEEEEKAANRRTRRWARTWGEKIKALEKKEQDEENKAEDGQKSEQEEGKKKRKNKDKKSKRNEKSDKGKK